MSKGRLLIPVFVLAIISAFALSACGSSGNSDESNIEEAIETSATSTDPSICTEFSTQNFAEQTSHESGSGAVKACEEEQKEGNGKAESVEVSNISVNGEKATAEAALTGGTFNGQTLEVELVEEEGKWKLNELTGFASFNGAKFAASFRQVLEAEAEKIPATVTSCIIGRVEEASQEEVEELVLNHSSKGFVEIAEGCQK